MKLRKVEIEGYRSITQKMTLYCKPNVTVILGANDHGKTNLLNALLHLNQDQPFESEDDLNWDLMVKDKELPVTKYHFHFDEDEIKDLTKILENEIYLELLKNITKGADDTFSHTSIFLDEELKIAQSFEQKMNEAITENETKTQVAKGSPESTDLRKNAIESKKKLEEVEQEKNRAENRVDTARVKRDKAEMVFLSAAAFEFKSIAQLTDKDNSLELEEFLNDLIEGFSNLESEHNSLVSKAKELKGRQAELESGEDKAGLKQAQVELINIREKVQASLKIVEKERDRAELTNQVLDFVKSDNYAENLTQKAKKPPVPDTPKSVSLVRFGTDGKLSILPAENLDEDICGHHFRDFVISLIPRVEMVSTIAHLPDSVTREDIESDEKSFLRGIFYYAGINKIEWDKIFVRNDETTKRLQDASIELNNILRKNWSQGRELEFFLTHDSKTDQIDLKINDPTVRGRHVRVSKRSSGFTHFFALRTILFAKQKESQANSYIWLFDEPGLYLHPEGQNDLLQVLETLGQANQIVYTTHSLFMINKNYPSRHCLVFKDDTGTRIDGKPYVGRWKSAIDKLGFSLPGTALFATKILLTEGDSDPMYLYALFQKLIESGSLQVDINSLSIIGTGESKNTEALVRILNESPMKPQIVVLFDGDDGGKNRKKTLEPFLKKNKIPIIILSDGSSIEDYLPARSSLFLTAVSQYVSDIGEIAFKTSLEKLTSSFNEEFSDSDVKLTCGVGKWSRKEGAQLAKKEDDLSPIGIAREYEQLLSGFGNDESEQFVIMDYTLELLMNLAKLLKLPEQTVSDEKIMD